MINFINDIFNELLFRKPNDFELNIFSFLFNDKLLNKKNAKKKKFIIDYIKNTNEFKQINRNTNILNNIYNFYLKRDIDNDSLIYYENMIKKNFINYNQVIFSIKNSKEYYYRYINLSLWNNYINNIKIGDKIKVLNSSINNCIIVEPRNHPHLESIVYKFAKYLGRKFQFQIFHGKNNVGLIENIKNNKVENLKSFNLDIENLSIDDYSDLLKSEIFWNNVEGENILIFQTDTIILKEFSDEYFEYDYIGAP